MLGLGRAAPLGGLVANRRRSGLAILGLTIGVAALIILIAVGNGSAATVHRRVESLGSNVLLVTRSFTLGGSGASSSPTAPLTRQDVDALNASASAPDVAGAAPVVNASPTLVHDGVSYSPASFIGTTPLYLTAHRFAIAAGSALTAGDLAHRSRVVVIGRTVVAHLFAGKDPVGQTLQVDGGNYRVVGVTASKGSNGVADQDDVAFAPLTAVEDTLTGYGNLSSITVQAKSRGRLKAAAAEVTAVLDGRHHIANPAAADFRVLEPGSILASSNSTSSMFTTLLGEVAAISLLVGGIGVMNVMLVSVTERTREIAIRRAVGARRADILAQFLAEAVLVSLVGGVSGVGLGVLASQFSIGGVEPAIATYSIFLAFGAALATGLLFGTYPAGRAAALEPIQALRHE